MDLPHGSDKVTTRQACSSKLRRSAKSRFPEFLWRRQIHAFGFAY
jgi:hypothetical protein